MNLRTLRTHRSPLALAAGSLGTLALALSMSGTVSAFSAQIQNTTNTAATGYLAMKETLLDAAGNPTATTCASNDGSAASVGANSATCSTINKYGGTAVGLAPGGATQTTRISITNTGSTPASAFTLTPTACTATALAINGGAAPANVCGKFNVTITSGTTTIYSGTAAGLTATPINLLAKLGSTNVAPGAAVPFTISVALDASADNTYAGFQVSQPLAWTFNA